MLRMCRGRDPHFHPRISVPEHHDFTLSRSRDPQIHPFPFQPFQRPPNSPFPVPVHHDFGNIDADGVHFQIHIWLRHTGTFPEMGEKGRGCCIAHQPFWELRDSFFSGVRSAFFTWLVPEHRKFSDKPRGQAVPEHRKFSFKPFQSIAISAIFEFQAVPEPPIFDFGAAHMYHFISRVPPPGSQAVLYKL